jgi:hypothetical protein
VRLGGKERNPSDTFHPTGFQSEICVLHDCPTLTSMGGRGAVASESPCVQTRSRARGLSENVPHDRASLRGRRVVGAQSGLSVRRVFTRFSRFSKSTFFLKSSQILPGWRYDATNFRRKLVGRFFGRIAASRLVQASRPQLVRGSSYVPPCSWRQSPHWSARVAV